MKNAIQGAICDCLVKQESINSYAPPYDSPIETIFAWNINKYISSDAAILKQYLIKTACSNFKLDFAIELGNRLVAVECDGKDYHDYAYDLLRDSLTLGEGHIQAVYRFKGVDLSYSINDCLYLFAKMESHFFSERGILNLETLASKEVKESFEIKTKSQMDYLNQDYQTFSNNFDIQYGYNPITIIKRTKFNCSELKNAFKFVQANVHIPFKETVKKYKASPLKYE